MVNTYMNIKIDVIIGNPPYSLGPTILYTKFFNKALHISKIVSFVMPTAIHSQTLRLREHNRLIKTHYIHISDDLNHHFDVGIKSIKNIIASINIKNEVKPLIDPLTQYTPIYPTRKRIEPRMGNGLFSHLKNIDENGVNCIVSLNRGDKVIWRKINPEIANKVKKSQVSSAPWILFIHQNPSRGLFNTHIAKNINTPYGCGVYAINADTYEEASELRKWLISPEIQAEVNKLLDLKETYSLSKRMASLLPYYK